LSSGKVHRNITLLAVPVTIGTALYFGGDLPGASQAAAGCIAAIWINPDLDLNYGPLPLRVLFWPYRRLIPHRSILSHGPIIGTIGRIAYLYSLVLLLCAVVGWPLVSLGDYGWLCGALMFCDLLHAIADCF
jgi:uncharacterized metal-binding protein